MTISGLVSHRVARAGGRSRRTRNGRRPPIAMPAVLTVTVALVLAGAPASARAGGPGQGVRGSRPAVAGIVSTFAGGVGGPAPATTVAIGSACGVDYAAGSVYLSDGPVRRVNAQTGQLTTPAGDTLFLPGPLGDGGLATRANVLSCGTPAVDRAGNLVVPDTRSLRVRVVAATSGTFYGQKMTAGHIYAVAGNGTAGVSAGGVPATTATLLSPDSVTLDSAGNIVLADDGSHILDLPALVQVVAVRTGTFYGQKMTAGYLYDIAGESLAVGVSGNGGPALAAGLGPNIGQVELDHLGDVLIANQSANSIRVIAEKTGSLYGQPMKAGDIYAVAGNGKAGYSGDGGPAAKAELDSAGGVTVDGAGNLIVSDTGNDRVRVVAVTSGTFYGQTMTAGDIYTIAGGGTSGDGDGGPATSVRLHAPAGVAVDGAGNVLLAETGGSVLNDQKTGPRVRLIAVKTGTFYRQPMTANDIYTIAGNGTLQFSGDGGPATRAELDGPEGVAFDRAGDFGMSDFLNDRVRFVPVRSGPFYGQKMTAGHIYTIAGAGGCNSTSGLGNGGPALEANLCLPEGARFDRAGNMLFADSGDNEVRVVAAESGTFYGQKMTVGYIYAVAGTGQQGYSGDGGPATEAELGQPQDVAVDQAGNLVIADVTNDRVRVVAAKSGTFYGVPMTAGDIYTVAGNGSPGFSGDGGPATQAQFNLPVSVSVDSAGNLLVSDLINNRIRVVAEKTGTFYGVKMTTGDIYTAAGSGRPRTPGFSGDGGPAVKARLARQNGIQLDPAGNLLIGDTGNNRVRVVAVKSGTFYGIKMTADDIYTVAGNGTAGYSGGGSATKAELYRPAMVTADSAGNLFFGSTERVLEVSG